MKENLIDYSVNLDESPYVHHLGLKTILKKAYINILDRNLIKNIECYKLKKSDNQTKNQYIQQVSNCFDKITNEINESTNEIINSILETKNAEKDFKHKTLNCYNLVSETEIETCYNMEFADYVNIYADLTRKFLKIYHNKYS